MPTTRDRSLQRLVQGGHWQNGAGNPVEQFSPIAVLQKTITDVTGKSMTADGLMPVSAVTIETIEKRWTPISYHPANPGASDVQFFAGLYPQSENSAHPFIGSRDKSFSAYATDLILRTSPFRAEFSVPVAIGELIECFTLLKFAWQFTLRGIGSNYLNLQFGWKPLVSQITDLVKITDSIESRIREFNSLHRKGGLHRRIKLDSFGVQSTENNHLIQSFLTTQRGPMQRTTKVRYYGSVRWFPKHDLLPEPDPLVAFRNAALIVLDLDPRAASFSSLWELIPFSWLVDYFLNISELLSSTKGRQLVEPRYITVSRWRETKQSMRAISSTRGNPGAKTVIRTTLDRQTFPDGYQVSSVAFNSLLSGTQITNLVALLFTMRAKWKLEG